MISDEGDLDLAKGMPRRPARLFQPTKALNQGGPTFCRRILQIQHECVNQSIGYHGRNRASDVHRIPLPPHERSTCYRSSVCFAQTFDTAAKVLRVQDALQHARPSKCRAQERPLVDSSTPAIGHDVIGKKCSHNPERGGRKLLNSSSVRSNSFYEAMNLTKPANVHAPTPQRLIHYGYCAPCKTRKPLSNLN